MTNLWQKIRHHIGDILWYLLEDRIRYLVYSKAYDLDYRITDLELQLNKLEGRVDSVDWLDIERRLDSLECSHD